MTSCNTPKKLYSTSSFHPQNIGEKPPVLSLPYRTDVMSKWNMQTLLVTLSCTTATYFSATNSERITHAWSYSKFPHFSSNKAGKGQNKKNLEE